MSTILPLIACAAVAGLAAQAPADSFDQARAFLNTYCRSCHEGRTAAGGFRLDQVASAATLRSEAERWSKLNARVQNGEMPPKGAPAPSDEQRERFTGWVDARVRAEVCAAGPVPGPSMIRRLNRDEYAATVRDLFDIHLDIASALPADGAGGEGFDNAAETLFLSPLHAEKYMDVARFVIDFATREFKSRARILTAQPGPGISPDQAAREIFRTFLPRAFRRPVDESDVRHYTGLYLAALKQRQPWEAAVLFAARAALVSPRFLFRAEPPNHSAAPRPLDQYALASRLSYFLWGSMPDELLLDVAAAGKLNDPEVLKQLVPRMLRNDKSLGFAQTFIEQWLRTRELASDKAPDAKLFPSYATDEELRSDIRFQPILFFREVLNRNLSVLNFLESRHTIGTSNLARHFGVKLPLRQGAAKQPQWVELPEGSRRGGLLGMPAVLAVSSYPYRTSPVLRGTWILESLLGTPPPPPPPDVPSLDEPEPGIESKTVRERLVAHRANAACASCHDRIDPLGFGLENFDAIGRWREQEDGRPVDSSGVMADGTRFHGPDQLKALLVERKHQFVRNLTTKLLGYALGRGLTLADSCTVEAIAAQLKDNDYRAQALIEAIVLSVPFRYQAVRAPSSGARKEQDKP